MLEFTFLTKKQVTGIRQIDILKKYGRKCAITDFAILLGGFASDSHTVDYSFYRNRTGIWWTQTCNSKNDYAVYTNGACSVRDIESWYIGARPVTTYSEILKYSPYQSGVINDLKQIYCGEYPQWVVDEVYSVDLEVAYKNGKMIETGKYYTANNDVTRLRNHFVERKYPEYKYYGKKYIRLIANPAFDNTALSDGRVVKSQEVCWISVEPIIWLVDEKNDVVLSKYILFSGLPLKYSTNTSSDFTKSDIKKFMDECFSKEIIEQSRRYKVSEIDSLFEGVVREMNELNNNSKIKVLK